MAKKKTFESALQELENIVSEMESGELSLEDAVKKYEQGIKQSRFCMELLDKTEKKITQLTTDEAGKASEVPFEEQE